MEVGKLYRSPDHYLMIYPTHEYAMSVSMQYLTATANAQRSVGIAMDVKVVPAVVGWWARYWSKQLGCKVRFGKPDEVFIFLGHRGELAHVLFGEQQGWIIVEDRLNIERALQ